MIKRVIDNKSLSFLFKTIGSELISFEIGESEKNFNRSYGKMRINFSNGFVDLSNLQKPTSFMNDTDDISGFECVINDSIQFKPYLDEKKVTLYINEKIKEISIIEDYVRIAEINECFVFDEAIVMQTCKNTYMVSRDWQYGEIICINNHGDYDSLNPIEKVKDEWSNFGDYDVDVKRTIKKFDGNILEN